MRKPNAYPSELLTRQFYDWEYRGRGWVLADEPVQLEPPFVPFFYHSTSQRTVDDGRRPTILSRIADVFRTEQKLQSTKPLPHTLPIEPFAMENDDELLAFSISLPKESRISTLQTEQLLVMLSFCNYPVSFEIIASSETITIQFVCRESDAFYFISQVKAYIPECIVTTNEEDINSVFGFEDTTFIVDFGLAEEFMRPLAMSYKPEQDPYIGLFGILQQLEYEEHTAMQVLFSGTQNAWGSSIKVAVSDNNNKSFFVDAPDMPNLADEKISAPLFAVTIRLIVQGKSTTTVQHLMQRLAFALQQVARSPYNHLIPLESEAYDFQTRVDDVLLRQSHRLGMLLNVKELNNFIHLPSASVPSLKLSTQDGKTKAAPLYTKSGDLLLGINQHEGNAQPVYINIVQRLKHMHIVGATGTGKSTLLTYYINQDISNGNGCTILDPHGDLIESILQSIPASRIKDVVLIDPSDATYPVGLNMLSAQSDLEKELLASDIVAVFRRLSTSWGDQMTTVLSNALLAFMESSTGGTIVELRRFLLEKDFRNSFLETITDENILYYWQKEFPILKTNSIGPILTRLDSFLRPKLIRNMVSQQKTIDFNDIINNKKILLVKLSQGLIGTENSYLLGTFIVSKIHNAAIARQAREKAERTSHFLYIDEFHHFSTPSMTQMLSGVRKYGLGLILAHQDMQQLQRSDADLAASILTNAGTRVCFRVGETDAKKFEDGFSYFTAADIQNLNTGNAIVRIERPEYDFNITVPKQTEQKDSCKEQVITHSRNRYATPLAEMPVAKKVDVPIEPISEYVKEITGINAAKMQGNPQQINEPLQKQSIAASTTDQLSFKQETQHRYLQNLIKRMAESKGYTASLEVPVQEGLVDVVLIQNEKRIACEISVSTDATWEFHNLTKCLHADFDQVIMCVSEKKTGELLIAKIKTDISTQLQEKILVLSPDELFHYLDQKLINTAPAEQRIKGYRVKVSCDQLSVNEMQQKQTLVSKVVLGSLRKMKR